VSTAIDTTTTDGGDATQVAFSLEQAILSNARNVSEATWELAGDLYHFHEIGGWSLCGYDTLEEFLARPELGLSRSQFFRLTKAYRDLVVVRKIDVDELKQIEPSKVQEVIPAIMRGSNVEKALTDAKELGRRDLRTKYRKGDEKEGIKPSGKPPVDDDEPDFDADPAAERVECPHCGTLVDPSVFAGEEPPVIDVEPVEPPSDDGDIVADPATDADAAAEVQETTAAALEGGAPDEEVVVEEPDPATANEGASVHEELVAVRTMTRTLSGIVQGIAVVAGISVGGALAELRKRAASDDAKVADEATSAIRSLGLQV
jgi:hypothetical protein